MPVNTEQIERCREEIARLESTIADVEREQFGPLRYQVLEILRSSLTRHRQLLSELES